MTTNRVAMSLNFTRDGAAGAAPHPELKEFVEQTIGRHSNYVKYDAPHSRPVPQVVRGRGREKIEN